jgi:gluconokinase
MCEQLADDSSDGDDANLVGLRALGEDEPLVDPNADTFELDLGAGRRVVIPMDRGAQRRGVAGASGTEAQSETGAVVWDGAVLLARANALEPPERKRDVLELGAGCGLAGLAWALTEDCTLTLTDRPHRLRALRENARRNGVEATVAALDWTRALEDAEHGSSDVVLAADCVYDEALATPLVRTMSYAMRDGAVALVTVDEANRRPTALKAFLRVAERAFSSFREEPMAARSKWSRGDDRESIRLFVCRGPRLFDPRRPLRVIIAGPCGCGKTTVGRELAAVLGLPFIEGDDLHPAENVAKMKRGEALDDADRAPWLSKIRAAVGASREGAVASCSALKQMYRDALGPVRIVLLDVPEAVARERVEERSGHYMPASLVKSQYAALELPALDCRTLVFDGTLAPSALVDEIVGTIAGDELWRRSCGHR